MSREYTVSFVNVAVTAQQDLFELVAASGKPIRIRGGFISQSSDVGDAQEEILQLQLKAGQTTSGSGGTAPTPVPLNSTDAAAGFTAEANNTTKASAGTIVTHHAAGWNVRQEHVFVLPPEMCVELTGARRATLELASTPADSLTLSGTLYVEEFG